MCNDGIGVFLLMGGLSVLPFLIYPMYIGLEFVYTTNDIRAEARPLQHMIIETPTEAS